MKERLLYAIHTCKEIDNDFIVGDTFGDDEMPSSIQEETEESSVCTTQ